MAVLSNAVEVHLQNPEQIYNSLDPSPFHERDLDDEAERFIIGSARELRTKTPLNIIITLPQAACEDHMAKQIPHAIKYHFGHRARQTSQDLTELLRVGRRFMAIGLTVLLLCFLAIQYLNVSAASSTMARLLEQSLLILGWVANWRPLEIFLYDWIPVQRQLALLRRLSNAHIVVKPV
jgi:hypothetical protein